MFGLILIAFLLPANRHKEKHGKGNVENQPAPANLDDEQLKKALEEEAAMMNQLKVII